MLTVVATLGTVGASGANLPEGLMIAVAVFVIVVPLATLSIGAFLTVREAAEKNRKRQERINQALEQVQEEDEDDVGPAEGTLTSMPSMIQAKKKGGSKEPGSPAVVHQLQRRRRREFLAPEDMPGGASGGTTTS